MAEEKVLTDKPLITEIREKSFNDILREQADSRNKEEVTEPTEEEKKKEEDEKAAKEAQNAKEKVEAEEADRKRQEEIATKAAEDVINKQKEEEKAREDKIKAEEAEKQRQEDLKPKFTGKDAEGNVVPKNYEEITEEATRIAEAKALDKIRAEQAEKASEAKKIQDEKTQSETQKKEQQKSFEDQLQKELDADLNDLYASNKLPKVKDPKDENDEGNKEFKNLFETAQRVNAERIAKGLPIIRSIKLIYYEHYKPLKQPAGGDAPVMGSESTLSREAPEDKYIPSRDRNKSMAQLVREEALRLGKKVGIRGN